MHIVLFDEDFNPWCPSSDWSCMLEMTFFEKYSLTTKLKQLVVLKSINFSNRILMEDIKEETPPVGEEQPALLEIVDAMLPSVIEEKKPRKREKHTVQLS